MAVVLLIVGLTLFLLGTLGLVVRFRERGKPALLVLFPIVSAPYARECWPDVRFFIFARLLGLALVAVGIGVAVARDPMILDDPRRLWGVEAKPYIAGSEQVDMNRFVNASEAILMAIRRDTNKDLSGRVHGEPFTYDRVEFIEGVLSARQGAGFLPELEVRIFLDNKIDDPSFDDRTTVSVQPGDPVSPVIHLSWLDDQGKLQTRIIRRGYRMELQFARVDRHQLKGFLQLILPDATRSYLSGKFIAYTNHLRYSNGSVDRGFTHPDTLEYVARRYLTNQYPGGAIERISFSDTRIQGSRTEGSTVARIDLDGGRVERREIGLQLSHNEWVVRRETVSTEVVRARDSADTKADTDGGGDAAADAGSDASQTSGGLERVVFAELAEHKGKRIRTERTDGKVQQGTLKKVTEYRIVLETSLGSGTVQYHVEREKLARVELPDGRTLILKESARDKTAAPGDRAETRDESEATGEAKESADESDKPAEPSTEGLEALRALEGKRVRITATDGKTRTGVLKKVGEREITLTVPMGGGSVDYYYKPDEVRSFERARER